MKEYNPSMNKSESVWVVHNIGTKCGFRCDFCLKGRRNWNLKNIKPVTALSVLETAKILTDSGLNIRGQKLAGIEGEPFLLEDLSGVAKAMQKTVVGSQESHPIHIISNFAFITPEKLKLLIPFAEQILLQLSFDPGHHNGNKLCHKKVISVPQMLDHECSYAVKVKSGLALVRQLLPRTKVQVLAVDKQEVDMGEVATFLDVPTEDVYATTPVDPATPVLNRQNDELSYNRDMVFVANTTEGIVYAWSFQEFLKRGVKSISQFPS